jgi:hypothetical protein
VTCAVPRFTPIEFLLSCFKIRFCLSRSTVEQLKKKIMDEIREIWSKTLQNICSEFKIFLTNSLKISFDDLFLLKDFLADKICILNVLSILSFNLLISKLLYKEIIFCKNCKKNEFYCHNVFTFQNR